MNKSSISSVAKIIAVSLLLVASGCGGQGPAHKSPELLAEFIVDCLKRDDRSAYLSTFVSDEDLRELPFNMAPGIEVRKRQQLAAFDDVRKLADWSQMEIDAIEVESRGHVMIEQVSGIKIKFKNTPFILNIADLGQFKRGWLLTLDPKPIYAYPNGRPTGQFFPGSPTP